MRYVPERKKLPPTIIFTVDHEGADFLDIRQKYHDFMISSGKHEKTTTEYARLRV